MTEAPPIEFYSYEKLQQNVIDPSKNVVFTSKIYLVKNIPVFLHFVKHNNNLLRISQNVFEKILAVKPLSICATQHQIIYVYANLFNNVPDTETEK